MLTLTAMAEPILITTCAPPSSLRGSSTMAPRVKKLVTKHNLARNVQSWSAMQSNTWAASSTGKPHLLQSPATAIIGIPLQRLSCWPAAAGVWTELRERPRKGLSPRCASPSKSAPKLRIAQVWRLNSRKSQNLSVFAWSSSCQKMPTAGFQRSKKVWKRKTLKNEYSTCFLIRLYYWETKHILIPEKN